jgi:hypothetical protein
MMKPLVARSSWSPSAPPPLSIFTPRERRLIARLRTPEQVQRWLNRLPYNREHRGETLRTLHGVMRHRNVHCLEAALAAATILEQHGYPPLIMDLESVDKLDHVMFLFRRGGRFGTVARSRDPGLHGRKPVYRNLRSLALGYSAPYIDSTARLHGYGVLDLRTLGRGNWRVSRRNVWYVERALIDNRHRKFRVSDAFHRRWRRRYLEFKRLYPRERPTFYPNRATWMQPRDRALPPPRDRRGTRTRPGR